MFIYIVLFVFVLGAVVGSFLNVVILRYRKKSILGRSACNKCEKELEWFELLPIFSFLIQRGRCRKCGVSISWQYPLVELVNGAIFVTIFYFLVNFYQIKTVYDFPFLAFSLSFLLLAVVWSTLVVIFVYDLYHKIIPDRFVFIFIFFSLLWLFNSADSSAIFSFPVFMDISMGFILFSFFASLWYFSRGTWMGFGDAKLALGMGFLLGFSKGFVAFMLAFWIGAGVSLVLLALKKGMKQLKNKNVPRFLKELNLKSEVPFAPFLILGTFIAFFFAVDVLDLVSFFN